MNEAEEQDEIFAGEENYPELPPVETDLNEVSAAQKLEACMRLDAALREHDPRVTRVQAAVVSTSGGTSYLRNTYGLRLSSADSYGFMYCAGVAQ